MPPTVTVVTRSAERAEDTEKGKNNMSELRWTPAAVAALARGDMDNFIAAATPGGIEAQEKAGQSWFNRESVLPIDAPWEQLEALGFVRGDPVDDLFTRATFPVGWSTRPTNHAMWSDLLDEQGRKRGAIFYKAAFYDRSAHMYLVRRYSHQRIYPEGGTGATGIAVTDGDATIAELPLLTDKWDDSRANAYLDEHYPDWRNELAYW